MDTFNEFKFVASHSCAVHPKSPMKADLEVEWIKHRRTSSSEGKKIILSGIISSAVFIFTRTRRERNFPSIKWPHYINLFQYILEVVTVALKKRGCRSRMKGIRLHSCTRAQTDLWWSISIDIYNTYACSWRIQVKGYLALLRYEFC